MLNCRATLGPATLFHAVPPNLHRTIERYWYRSRGLSLDACALPGSRRAPRPAKCKENAMKTLVSLAVAFGLVAAAAAPVLAADAPKTKAECEKAHMKWDATAKKCS